MFARLTVATATFVLLAIAAGQPASAQANTPTRTQAAVEIAPSSAVPAPVTWPAMNTPGPMRATPPVAETAPQGFIAPAAQTPSTMPVLQRIRR